MLLTCANEGIEVLPRPVLEAPIQQVCPLLQLVIGESLRVFGRGHQCSCDDVLGRTLCLEAPLLVLLLLHEHLKHVLFLIQLGKANHVEELEVVEGGDLWAPLCSSGPVHLALGCVLAVVEQALALTLGWVHPVVARQLLEIELFLILLLVLLELVHVFNASVHGELHGLVCEGLHLVIESLGILLTLGQDDVDICICQVEGL
mmetsp:Transcript_4407/g.7278  ORF Transcript_4407/g.7278 Transcript_4407/m.7278 type:complete len:203 (-) Transcript_4407:2018-2626(-)